MGFFKDVRDLKKQGEALRPPEHRGMIGGFRAMRDGVATANRLRAPAPPGSRGP
jgi:hypothetical protein